MLNCSKLMVTFHQLQLIFAIQLIWLHLKNVVEFWNSKCFSLILRNQIIIKSIWKYNLQQ